MAEITAAMVRDLRERSGLPMMDCKQALVETSGDVQAALELLRKRGAAAAEKKAGRATAEGRIGKFKDAQVAALVEMFCETAPVANNPLFRDLADQIAKHTALTGHTDPASVVNEPFVDDKNITIQGLLHDTLNKLRENMKIGRIVRANGRTGAYVHHTGKIGVLLSVEGDGGTDELLGEICMHIAFAAPNALSRDDMPADLVNREREIVREVVASSGKPANMLDKIVDGKMNRWFSERVLLEQAFVKDEKKTVGQVTKEAGFTIKKFWRLQVGEAEAS